MYFGLKKWSEFSIEFLINLIKVRPHILKQKTLKVFVCFYVEITNRKLHFSPPKPLGRKFNFSTKYIVIVSIQIFIPLSTNKRFYRERMVFGLISNETDDPSLVHPLGKLEELKNRPICQFEWFMVMVKRRRSRGLHEFAYVGYFWL